MTCGKFAFGQTGKTSRSTAWQAALMHRRYANSSTVAQSTSSGSQKRDLNQTTDTVRSFSAPFQKMDVHLEDDLWREILLHSAVAKFVLFGATSLFRNGQVVQRPDCRGWSAAKMSAQCSYL